MRHTRGHLLSRRCCAPTCILNSGVLPPTCCRVPHQAGEGAEDAGDEKLGEAAAAGSRPAAVGSQPAAPAAAAVAAATSGGGAAARVTISPRQPAGKPRPGGSPRQQIASRETLPLPCVFHCLPG